MGEYQVCLFKKEDFGPKDLTIGVNALGETHTYRWCREALELFFFFLSFGGFAFLLPQGCKGKETIIY